MNPLNQILNQCAPGRYDSFERIGAGAQAEVWRASRSDGPSPVALKVFRYGAGSPFYGELTALLRVQHANVVRLLDFHEFEGTRILVEEYCAGGSLRALLNLPHPIKLIRATVIARQIAAALTALHEASMIHGDVKPENVLLWRRTGPEVWKLGDFGLCCDARSGRRPRGGTPQYTAPEVVYSGNSAAADVFALGRILAELAAAMDVDLTPITRSGEGAPSVARQTSLIRPAPDAFELQALAREASAEEPERRPSAAQLLETLRDMESRLRFRRFLSTPELAASDSPTPPEGELISLPGTN